jgi:MEMO1 family protein
MVRPAAVAGRFYPDQPEVLSRQIDSFCPPIGEVRRRALACVVPHAGYMYSGHVAGSVFAKLELPSRFVLIGPRHFPRGAAQAILSEGAWETPFGLAQIDAALADELKRACGGLTEDDVAHRTEHALEVQLPFLQRLAGNFRFVPIALGTTDFTTLDCLGKAVGEVLSKQKEPVLIVASSDMNHYESDEITRRKDRLAIDQLLALDARGLYDVVRRENISMCGYGPAVCMLVAARLLGAKRAELVGYATSADVTGDKDSVVGYAGIIVE